MSARLNRRDVPASGQVNTVELSTTEARKSPPSSFPFISQDLLAHLRQTFAVSVARGREIREYDLMAGQQSVIEYLETLALNQ